ncbi:GAP family protein [Shewanella surugensis]|uniref:GAP family protein n=1 Tax=Shewanella surugensis TaxID=212020 RepID=A0ABT0L6P7_9GAMM|nr:GAP family protein [Shewanella surugensis]MCL1123376.1 GAP family protein [Shewanella surugensis]
MVSLIFILIAIALIDSTSMIPIALLPFAAILGGKRPIVGALSFILGIVLIYSLSGLLLLLGFDFIFEVIAPSMSRWWNQPNTIELILQLIVGAVLLIYAWQQYRSPLITKDNETIVAISPFQAFTLGVSLTIIGLPGAIPYFGAIEQILRAHLNFLAAVSALILYNVAFVLPFLALLLIRLLLPNHSGAVFGAISTQIKRWGKPIIVSCVAILGCFLVADSIGWFFGYPLLATNSL